MLAPKLSFHDKDYFLGNNPKTMTRSVFYVSDSTAMTAKGLGKSLMSQWPVNFKENLRPYTNTKERITQLLQDIEKALKDDGEQPIVFASIMDDILMEQLSAGFLGVIDIFRPFMSKLEDLMHKKSSKEVGMAHKIGDELAYQNRVAAIDFTLSTDDGLKTSHYDHADIILLGVSRSGKTPTALYLALNFGLKVANYPYTSEDLPKFKLIDAHLRNRNKLIGLNIEPQRLLNIRSQRLQLGSYADPIMIKKELSALTDLFLRENILAIDTTTKSVEEIAATIVKELSKS